jgi:hypothetical protein
MLVVNDECSSYARISAFGIILVVALFFSILIGGSARRERKVGLMTCRVEV